MLVLRMGFMCALRHCCCSAVTTRVEKMPVSLPVRETDLFIFIVILASVQQAAHKNSLCSDDQKVKINISLKHSVRAVLQSKRQNAIISL